MSKKIYIEQAELKHFGVLGMHWGVRRGNKPRPAEVRKAISSGVEKISNKANELKALGKKKFSELPERKQTGLKVLGIMAGTTVATIGLIKGSKATVNLIQKMDNLLYDDAINGIANAIIDMKNKQLGRP